MTQKEADKTHAIAELQSIVPQYSNVYGLVAKVSHSGMTRRIRLFIVTGKKTIRDISYRAAQVLGWSENENGIRVTGCGMDMIFHTISTLSYALGYDKDGKIKGIPDSITNCYGLNCQKL